MASRNLEKNVEAAAFAGAARLVDHTSAEPTVASLNVASCDQQQGEVNGTVKHAAEVQGAAARLEVRRSREVGWDWVGH